MQENCIPTEIFDMEHDQYEKFLELRREQIALKIKEFYFSL